MSAPVIVSEPPARPTPTATGATRRRAGLLILAAILLVAVNLRIAVTALGALLGEARTGLGMSAWLAGLVTALPTLAFAAVGAFTPWLARRVAADRILAGAMVALAAGQALRAITGTPAVFVAASGLALGGIAIANVLLPVLVKEHFPHRAGAVTGAYSVALITGATVGAAAAVPVADALGSWRAGLGAWALLAAVAVGPLLPTVLRAATRASVPSGAGRSGTAEPGVGRVRPVRTRLGWAMALYFGTQSLSGFALMGWLAQLFRDAGYSPRAAGLLLAAVTAIGVPVALFMPVAATRLATLRPIVLTLSAASALAYVGLAVAPGAGAVAWVTLLAIGQGGFPLILTAIGLRARTAGGTVALSAFAQSGGYVLGSLGPLLVGLLYEATDGWHASLGLLLAALIGQTLSGLAIARPRYIEDEAG